MAIDRDGDGPSQGSQRIHELPVGAADCWLPAMTLPLLSNWLTFTRSASVKRLPS